MPLGSTFLCAHFLPLAGSHPPWGCQKGWLRALKDSLETTANAIQNLEACVRGVLGAEMRGEVLQSVRLMTSSLQGR